MRLRNSRMATKRIREFQVLKSNLEEIGLYEKGMDLEEMRKINIILNESSSSTTQGAEEETSFNEVDIATALRESELDFLNQNVMNSTMIVSAHPANENTVESGYLSPNSMRHRRSSSPSSSPDSPLTLVVTADVHHELNWSPPRTPKSSATQHRVNCRKRAANQMSQSDSGILTLE